MKFFDFSKKIFLVAIFVSFLAPSFTVFAAAPTVTGLAANFSTNSVTLSWNTPSDASLSEFEIRYIAGSLNDGNFNFGTLISSPTPEAGTTQNLSVSNLNSATSYTFGVRARNFLGEESSIVYVSGSTTAGGGGGGGAVDVCANPTAATSMQTPLITANSISLSWILPNLSNLSDLEVRYAKTPINDGTFNLATEVSNSPLPEANATQNFTVGGLTSNTNYYFAIKLWNACGEESLITSVSATTALAGSGGACVVPSLPTSLAIGGVTANSLNMSWITPNQASLSELEARYSTQPLNDGNFNLGIRLNTPNPEAGTAQSANVIGLNPNTTYYFGLRVQGACGDYSGIVYVSGSTNNIPPVVGGGGGGSAVYSDTRLIINNGALTTNNRAVVLNIVADEPVEMWLSENKNFETGSWEPFATSTVWILSSGLGTKTVYVKFRDDQFTGFSQASDEIELVTGPNKPILPGTPAVSNTPPNNPVYVNNNTTVLSAGRVWLEIVPKEIKISGDGEIRAVVIAHADGVYADYFRLEMKYPTENLRLKSVEFAPGMLPDFSANSNFENIDRGLLVKSARSEVPFTGRKMFGVLIFEPLAMGQGSLEILSGANLGEDNWYSDISVVSNPGSNSNLMASLVSVNKENNVAAMLGIWMFFVLVYAGYLAFQKYKKGL
jgi:hypothetical protein